MGENRDDAIWARDEMNRKAQEARDKAEAERAVEQARRDAEKGKK